VGVRSILDALCPRLSFNVPAEAVLSPYRERKVFAVVLLHAAILPFAYSTILLYIGKLMA